MPEKNFRSLRLPLWTQNKARLIQEYLRLFLYITKHGTYIDGFAAPQEANHPEMWAAKLVLELEPKWLRDFWLCDINAIGIKRLEELAAEHSSRRRQVTVIPGDFNETVHQILSSGRITERIATFALLDQRTFECEWQTVVSLSQHKLKNKIELFYFFPTGWIDRSLAAIKKPDTAMKVDRWWGRSDWPALQGMDSNIRAKLVERRFEEELGYKKATIYPIHSDRKGGRVMYHMIHASDHPEASQLMVRAYRKVSGRPELDVTEQQTDFDTLWKESDDETDHELLQTDVDEVPASDRFVQLDHNSQAYRQAIEAGEKLLREVRKSNSFAASTDDDKEQRIAELEAGYRLLTSKRVDASNVKLVLGGVLGYLATKFADEPIGELAKVAWNTVKSLLGLT